MNVRAFDERDYERWAEIRNANFMDYPMSVAELKAEDEAWPVEGDYYRLRLVLEDAPGHIVAVGDVSHIVWQYHPRKYYVNLVVEPAAQKRGYGSALYERLIAEIERRGAVSVRTEVRESMQESVRFATDRGFQEIAREWESRLDVPSFRFDRFEAAERRVTDQGFELTTLASELERHPDALQRAYELQKLCDRDVPSYEPVTDTPYEMYLSYMINSPGAMPDAYFLAKDGDTLIGQSVLQKSAEMPDVYIQELTGVRREYRGRGIAMALKLRTVRYARERGVREIRTWNSTLNRPMVSINEAMGFGRQPAWIEMIKTLDTASSSTRS